MRGTMRWVATAVLLGAVTLAARPADAQSLSAEDVGAALLERPDVRRALDEVRRLEPETLETQVALSEIPAPPFAETERGRRLAELFRAAGLQNVRTDEAGNVVAERPGLAERPHVLMTAHLDTVFPEGTDVSVTRAGTELRGPGVGDDARGLAVLVAVAGALEAADVQTAGQLTFVGTVGEEGLGDLRGVKQLFAGEFREGVDAFVSIDGSGLGITHVGVGSRRYRVTFTGPGGHSYGDFGMPNPVHALGRAISSLADFQVPPSPRTTFSVGRVGGGTSINAIAYEAWMEVDLRSSDRGALSNLDERFRAAVATAVDLERRRWNDQKPLEVTVETVGDRPAGATPREASIVRAAVSVTEALGAPTVLMEGSTDANLPMSLDVPAITIDGGGEGSGSHSLEEVFDFNESWRGTQRALLLAVALTEELQ